MKKIILGFLAVTIIAGAVFFPKLSGAQTSNSNQLAAELTFLSTVISTVSSIENQRQNVRVTIGSELLEIMAEIKRIAAMPSTTESEKAAMSQEINRVAIRLSALAPVISTLNQIRAHEISILDMLRVRLVNLSTRI